MVVMADSKPGADWTQLAIAAAVLVLLLAAVYLLPPMLEEKEEPPQEEEPISLEEFMATVQAAPEIAIVQDLRNIPDLASRKAVQDCAVNLSMSIAMSFGTENKKISNYVYDVDDVCYYSEANELMNKSIAECEQLLNNTYALFVAYGSASSTFYRNWALIYTNKYYGSACSIGVQAPPVEPEPIIISPNVTADTPAPDEIFLNCSMRNYCESLGPHEEQSCLEAAAMQITGDPRCCFGIQNITIRDSCIEGLAGMLHGFDEDYCQFVSSDDLRDSCYFEYGTTYYHEPYCENIVNPLLKEECLQELE
ncbi:MAG: hypothetical protein KAT35_06265 [Candidatus Aenigmarchaeota archaeon]|nr:hypothetical protein [Candidatus Aenigmarchaeota archaeon]